MCRRCSVDVVAAQAPAHRKALATVARGRAAARGHGFRSSEHGAPGANRRRRCGRVRCRLWWRRGRCDERFRRLRCPCHEGYEGKKGGCGSAGDEGHESEKGGCGTGDEGHEGKEGGRSGAGDEGNEGEKGGCCGTSNEGEKGGCCG